MEIIETKHKIPSIYIIQHAGIANNSFERSFEDLFSSFYLIQVLYKAPQSASISNFIL